MAEGNGNVLLSFWLVSSVDWLSTISEHRWPTQSLRNRWSITF